LGYFKNFVKILRTLISQDLLDEAQGNFVPLMKNFPKCPYSTKLKKVKQSRYRPGVAQRVPES